MPYVSRDAEGRIVGLYHTIQDPIFHQTRNYLSNGKMAERLGEYPQLVAEAQRLGVSIDAAAEQICARWPEWLSDAELQSEPPHEPATPTPPMASSEPIEPGGDGAAPASDAAPVGAVDGGSSAGGDGDAVLGVSYVDDVLPNYGDDEQPEETHPGLIIDQRRAELVDEVTAQYRYRVEQIAPRRGELNERRYYLTNLTSRTDEETEEISRIDGDLSVMAARESTLTLWLVDKLAALARQPHDLLDSFDPLQGVPE